MTHWPLSAPGCLSSLRELPPSPGSPYGQAGGQSPVWTTLQTGRPQTSPAGCPSSLFWAPLAKRHRITHTDSVQAVGIKYELVVSKSHSLYIYKLFFARCTIDSVIIDDIITWFRNCTDICLTSRLGRLTKAPRPPRSGPPWTTNTQYLHLEEMTD